MPIQLKKSYNQAENSDMYDAFNRVLIGILTDICLFVTFSKGKGQMMMLFSTGTGLERVGIVGPKLELPLGRTAGSDFCAPLQKQVTKGDRRGLARRHFDA